MRSTFRDPPFSATVLKICFFLNFVFGSWLGRRPNLIRLLLLQCFVVVVSFLSFCMPPDLLTLLTKISASFFFHVY